MKSDQISKSYTMGCLPVCGNNPRALANRLSYQLVDKHGITILYHLHHEIFHAKVGKGGISEDLRWCAIDCTI